MTRPLTALVIVVLAAAASPLVAQQRKPRVELYGLTGVYSPGVGRDRSSPQAGAGVLLPVGRNWAAVVDFGIGVVPVHTKFRYLGHALGPDAAFYRRNPQLTNINEHWTNEATLRPSFVRVLRHDRVSFWLGAGIGAEFEYNRWRHKRIREVHDKDGNAIPADDEEPFGLLVLDEHFTAGDDWSPHLVLLGSFGVSASLSERTVVRFGYSCVLTYLDKPLPVVSSSVSATASSTADRAAGIFLVDLPSRPACATGKQPRAECVSASCTPTQVSLDGGMTFDMRSTARNLQAAGHHSTHLEGWSMPSAPQPPRTSPRGPTYPIWSCKIRLCASFAGPRLLFAVVKPKGSEQGSGLAVPSSSISSQSGGRPERWSSARTQSASLVR